MYNEIRVSVDELTWYGEELNLAVVALSEAMQKAENEKHISKANVSRLKEACSELQSLVDSVRLVALEYEGLEKDIVDALSRI